MEVEIPKEKWNGKVREVTLGGGDGRHAVTMGGATTLPFLHFEGAIPHRPIIAVDVEDRPPEGWARPLLAAWGDATGDPARWAAKAVELGGDVIALTLASAHPDAEDTGPQRAVETAKRVLAAVDAPLIVYGPGVAEKDNEVLLAVADATSGLGLALGVCEDKNYRTIVAGCLANGHLAIAKTPIDLNLAKQLNILISDMGLPPERILMDPTTGALGYGVEYAYSVMERLRLAALQGDPMTAMPMISTVGYEAWRQKEAKVAEGTPAAWGDFERRGILWEATTASTMINAGADIVVMRHPEAIALVQKMIDQLMAAQTAA